MAPTPKRQRRRHPRIEIDGTVTAQDLTTGAVVVIRDLSAGGFKTESPRPAAIGHTHLFRVRLPHGETCVLQAAAVHCQATTGARQATLIGWRAESHPTTTDALRRLIEAVTTLDPNWVNAVDAETHGEARLATVGSKVPVRPLRWPRG
jgi:hypothetical protein